MVFSWWYGFEDLDFSLNVGWFDVVLFRGYLTYIKHSEVTIKTVVSVNKKKSKLFVSPKVVLVV